MSARSTVFTRPPDRTSGQTNDRYPGEGPVVSLFALEQKHLGFRCGGFLVHVFRSSVRIDGDSDAEAHADERKESDEKL